MNRKIKSRDIERSDAYKNIYKHLDNMAALFVAESTVLHKRTGELETDTEFVKRIVAHYLVCQINKDTVFNEILNKAR